MDLYRKAYAQMLKWKEKSQGSSALLIEGARRVGKSYLVRKFAQNEYESCLYLDFSNIEKEVISLFENEMNPLDMFFLKLQSFYAVKLKRRKSCIVFDEVQMYPRARQMIKHLVADHLQLRLCLRDDVFIRPGLQKLQIPVDRLQLVYAVGGDHLLVREVTDGLGLNLDIGDQVSGDALQHFGHIIFTSS